MNTVTMRCNPRTIQDWIVRRQLLGTEGVADGEFWWRFKAI
ncbi:MAG: hypothetical protein U0T85_01465 [Cloacibacterium normanense]